MLIVSDKRGLLQVFPSIHDQRTYLMLCPVKTLAIRGTAEENMILHIANRSAQEKVPARIQDEPGMKEFLAVSDTSKHHAMNTKSDLTNTET